MYNTASSVLMSSKEHESSPEDDDVSCKDDILVRDRVVRCLFLGGSSLKTGENSDVGHSQIFFRAKTQATRSPSRDLESLNSEI